MVHSPLGALAPKLSPTEPAEGGVRSAAVALVFRTSRSLELLLIERARRSGDPWSGQVALPGGKRQPEDVTAMDTAVRETFEEVGFDLREKARFLGYAEPMRTHTGTMDVVPSVFVLKERVRVRANGEVASHKWIRLSALLSPEARSSYHLEYGGRRMDMPAYRVGGYVVWGLTHRILSALLEDGRKI